MDKWARINAILKRFGKLSDIRKQYIFAFLCGYINENALNDLEEELQRQEEFSEKYKM